VAAGVALVVGLLSPIVTSFMANRRQRIELREARFNRTRDDSVKVVEEAAIAFSRARRALERLQQLWLREVRPTSDDGKEAFSEQRAALLGLRNATGLLSLRFADDDVMTTSFWEARRALDAYRRQLRGYRTDRSFRSEVDAVEAARIRLLGLEDRWLDAARRELPVPTHAGRRRRVRVIRLPRDDSES
jgi:hypothetical protein